jgi:spermidine synthase
VYQTVWLREFRLVFGASTAANAAVLAVFIAGLGAGSLVLGGRADRHARPLAFYAHLELAIAAFAAVTPGLLSAARAAYLGLGGSSSLGSLGATVMRLLLTTVVLLGPTFLMGGTLPAVARALETPSDRGRRELGLLYGVNTLGAVTGCLLATFVLLEAHGARQTLWFSCIVNLLLALAALELSKRLPALAGSSDEAEPGGAEPVAAESPPPPAWLTLAASGVAGFGFFLMELVWYRMLGPLLGGTIYAFGIILSLALLGIGLGGAFHSLLGRKKPATIGSLSLSFLLEAACIAVPYALGDRIAVLALYLRPFGTLGFGGFVASWCVVGAIVVIPAAFVAGVQFPLLIGLLGRGNRAVGEHVGRAYAANTAGAIAGALAGGFGLLPLLSAPGAWRAVAWFVMLVGCAAAGVDFRQRRHVPSVVVSLALAACILALTAATGPTAVFRHSPIGVGSVPASATASPSALHKWMRQERDGILWEADGIESSVAMSRATGLAFIVNGKIDGHARVDAATQVMSGLVGAALHPAPKSALVIGLGTGSTAGWLAAVPSIARVDVHELEPKVVEVARQCRAVNHDVLANPKVSVTLGDARELLTTTQKRYDLIVSEPSNPYRAGISAMYTREYYQAARNRLGEDGLFLQWMQAYNVDATTIATIYATLGSVFPHVETWELAVNDLLLVGSARPLRVDVPRLSARLSEEPFRSALVRTWRTTRVQGFLSHFVADAKFARALAGTQGDTVGTDDRNPIEFGFARGASMHGSFSAEKLRMAAHAQGQDRPTLAAGTVDEVEVADEWNAFAASERAPVVLRENMPPEQRARAHAEAAFVSGDLAAAVHAWRSQTREPQGPTELAILAMALAAQGDKAALPYIEELARFEPVEGLIALAKLRAAEQRYEDAAAALAQAFVRYRSDPWPWLLVTQTGLDAAVDVAGRRPALAARLNSALFAPFAARLLDQSRLIARTLIAMRIPGIGQCVPTIADLEPHVPWRLDILTFRTKCYRDFHQPEASLAAAELEAFLGERPMALSDLLPAPQ